MSSDEKPEPKGGELSAPNLEDVDSHWGDDDDLDEDATTVAKIPQELMALSRRGNELEKPGAAAKKEEAPPEKHDAITARPPPMAAEQSVVVDAPHETIAEAAPAPAPAVVEEEDDEDEEDDEEADLDAGWDELAAAEEKRAAAADEAAGLDAEARRKAAEERAVARKDKARAKTLAAKEKRKAKSDAQKQRQKKPKKRSIPPPRARTDSQPPTSRQRVTGRPAPLAADAAASPSVALAKPQRDVLRMVFFVALVVVLGAFVIGLARR
jgi:hypothetical protein